ncbi:MAG: peptidase MA family metallohydrolase [bacterium]
MVNFLAIKKQNIRYFLEFIFIIYLVFWGPLSPFNPFIAGFSCITREDITLCIDDKDDIQLKEKFQVIEKAQERVLSFWEDRTSYPDKVKIFLVSDNRYWHMSMYNNDSSALVQGNNIIVNYRYVKHFLEDVLTHEISHHYLSSKLPLGIFVRYKVPRWLDEGLAVIISEEKYYEIENFNNYEKHFKAGGVVGSLKSGLEWSRGVSRLGSNFIYSYSNSFVRYLIETFGKEKIQHYLNSLSLFSDVDYVFQEIYQESPSSLEKKWLINMGG